MKKNDKKPLDDNFIEQKVAKAFGYTDEQLADELDGFVRKAEKSSDRVLEAPEGEFQRIWDRVERESSGRCQRRKSGRVRKAAKAMAVAAILGAMVLGGGMWVGAKRHYVYEVRERGDLDNVIVFNNSKDNLITDDILDQEKAYEQIKQELGMQVFELSYLPEGAVFYNLEVLKNTSKMEFAYGEDWLYFYQGISEKPSSLSYASDMKKCDNIFNSFLDMAVPIYGKELGDGNIEFSIRITKKNYYYILEGIIDIKDFVQIVYGIRPYKTEK